jgi:hypothetical protein
MSLLGEYLKNDDNCTKAAGCGQGIKIDRIFNLTMGSALVTVHLEAVRRKAAGPILPNDVMAFAPE